jgi:6-phosphogluconolactonase
MFLAPEIHVVQEEAQWAAEAATLILKLQRQVVDERGRFVVALSGGQTPKLAYERLVLASVHERDAWRSTHFLFGDERCVPPVHPDSNFRLAEEALFRPLDIRQDCIHRMRGELPDAHEAAREYEEVLGRVTTTASSEWPHLDLVLLGVGNDGHTASLFPGTDALHEHRRWVTVGHAPSIPRTRLTLTLGVINQATVILFLASGGSKASIIKTILEPRQEVDRQLPAALVRPERGRLIWLLDRPAAALLSQRDRANCPRPT